MKGSREKQKDLGFFNINFGPTDIMLLIFSYLSHYDLHIAYLVSKHWNKIANELHYYKIRQQQLRLLEGSDLWRHLNSIANKENILPYLEKHVFLDKENKITKLSLHEFFVKLNALFSMHVYWKTSAVTRIENMANSILEKHQTYRILPAATLENFFKFPIEHAKKQKEVFQDYLRLEEDFATLRMMIQFRKKKDYKLKKQAYIDLVCDIQANRHLTGAGLIFINEIFPLESDSILNPTCLIQELIKESIEKKVISTTLNSINNILRRITASDWENFLLLDQSKSLHSLSRVKTLILAFRHNHSIILETFNETILMKIARGNYGSLPGILILQSSITLKHLSNPCVIELISRLPSDDFKKILEAHPQLIQRFDFESAMPMLTKNQRLAKIFLMNTYFLNTLKDKDTQIPAIAKFLVSSSATEILQSPEFLAMLDAMALAENGKQVRSHFLVKLAKANLFIPSAIIEDDHILNMLELDDRRKIASLDPGISEKLVKPNRLLSSSATIYKKLGISKNWQPEPESDLNAKDTPSTPIPHSTPTNLDNHPNPGKGSSVTLPSLK